MIDLIEETRAKDERRGEIAVYSFLFSLKKQLPVE
jgi:hypothetical protein